MAVKNGGPGADVINFRPLGNSNDFSHGNDKDDTIFGGGGNDRLFGDAGNDTLFGDAGNDILNGAAGKDRLIGAVGDDRLLGGSGDDDLRGGAGEDFLVGDIGKDFLQGGSQTDQLNGGQGRDLLDGGLGQDFLRGGPEFAVRDDFVFAIGKSNSTNDQADTILDWTSVDRVVTDVAGTAANYGEHSAAGGAVDVTDIASARADAEAAHTNKIHMFFFDAATDTGYLVSDLNNDNIFETGVVLNGAGSAADFSFANLID